MSDSCRDDCSCCIKVISVLVSLVFTAIAIHNTRDDSERNSPVPYYTPGDTMLLSLPHSSTFCDSLRLTDYSTVSATLYMLNEKPPLSGLNNFSVSSDPAIVPGDYYYLMYYLYPGAVFTLDACIASQPLDFYIIRGEHNFKAWKKNPKGSSWEEHLHISKPCPENIVQSFNFSNRASEYYFAFVNFGTTSSTVRATLNFERPEYVTNDSTIVTKCQAEGTNKSSSCSIDIPLKFSYYILLVVDPPSNGNWSTNVKIDWSCHARIWLCVVVVVVPMLFYTLCVILIVVACSYARKHRKENYYKKLFDPIDPQPKYASVNK